MGHLGLLDLLRLAEFNPGPHDRLVRHQHSVYSARALRERNLLDVFQLYQSRPVFHRADYIISFYALGGTRACFYGIFKKCSVRATKATTPLTDEPWEREWREVCKYVYELERLPHFTHLEDRLVIDWGRGTRSWSQKPSNKTVRIASALRSIISSNTCS